MCLVPLNSLSNNEVLDFLVQNDKLYIVLYFIPPTVK